MNNLIQKSVEEFNERWVGGEKPPIWDKFVDILISSQQSLIDEIVKVCEGMLGWETCVRHQTLDADCIECNRRDAINRTLADLINHLKK